MMSWLDAGFTAYQFLTNSECYIMFITVRGLGAKVPVKRRKEPDHQAWVWAMVLKGERGLYHQSRGNGRSRRSFKKCSISRWADEAWIIIGHSILPIWIFKVWSVEGEHSWGRGDSGLLDRFEESYETVAILERKPLPKTKVSLLAKSNFGVEVRIPIKVNRKGHSRWTTG
jgi:hypothetical protein